MPRDIGLYVEDMIEAATRLASYTDGLDFDGFAGDPRTVDAVVRNLEILGEAAKRVPDDVRGRAAEIDCHGVVRAGRGLPRVRGKNLHPSTSSRSDLS